MTRKPTRGEYGVVAFTFVYVAGFTAWFLSIGNHEFIVYVIAMIGLVALVALKLGTAEYTLPMLWALSLWDLMHMDGGGVPVDGAVLYTMRLQPVVDSGEVFILKYDQVVHAYGFGVTARVLHHVLTRHFPETRGTATAVCFPALAAMGLGAVNEIIEFSAVRAMPDTKVGGYCNMALDLVFNAAGAVVAMLLMARGEREGRG